MINRKKLISRLKADVGVLENYLIKRPYLREEKCFETELIKDITLAVEELETEFCPHCRLKTGLEGWSRMNDTERAIELNDNEVFNSCSYSCYVDIADALNRLKEYEAIGTVDELKKAIEKHMPKKICTACNGSGWYDNCDKYGKSIPCGACDGAGRVD